MAKSKHPVSMSLREAEGDQREIRRLLEESEARVREFFRARRRAEEEPEGKPATVAASDDSQVT